MSFIDLYFSVQKLTAADNSYRADDCEIFLLQYLLFNWDSTLRDKIAVDFSATAISTSTIQGRRQQ